MESADVLLRRFSDVVKAKGRRLSALEIAAWAGALQDVREDADDCETDLIRYLRFELRLRWQDVADVLGLETRQAAQQRWRRLKTRHKDAAALQ